MNDQENGREKKAKKGRGNSQFQISKVCRYTKLKCLIGSSRRVPLQTPSNAGNLSFETEVFLRVAEERMSSYNDDNIKPYKKRKQKRERKNELRSIKGGIEKGQTCR